MAVAALLVLGVIVVGIVLVIRRFLDRKGDGPSDGSDVIAYLLLALAVGTAGFSLAALATVAFPAGTFAFDRSQQVATSLAGLVVAFPISVYLWRRQAKRREEFPASSGWTVYLALIEAVFLTTFVVAATTLLDWLIGDGTRTTWADVVVYAGVVGFHEIARRRTPPRSDSADLPRVVGSAIGLIATSIAATGILYWLLNEAYGAVVAQAGSTELMTWVSLLIVAAPVWYLRWWTAWRGPVGVPRQAWLFVVSVASLATTIAAAAFIGVETLIFVFTETEAAGRHFEFLPVSVSVGVVGSLVWLHHRRALGVERTSAVASYQYAMTAIGLAFAVGGATWLTALAFGSEQLVSSGADAIIAAAATVIVAGTVWWRFWSEVSAGPREDEATSTPRRFYLLGMGVIMGLVSAGALIASLVVLFQLALGDGGGEETLVTQGALFVFAGLATWHLLRENATDRGLIVSDETVTPFDVTIICSHPGSISAQFHERARVKVIYRADEEGVIGSEMADAIVSAVGHRSSLVWVDADGFRVSAAR